MTETALTTKEVNFYGDTLLAIYESETQKIYVAINCVLRGLGFNNKQIEYQRDKWTLDKVIAKGTLKFSGTLLNAKTGKDMWCITLSKLPLALAKINITPAIEREAPEIAAKLEQYQDECADILAAAFLPQSVQQSLQSTNSLLEQSIMGLQQSQQNLIDCMMEQGYQLQNHEQEIESLNDSVAQLEESLSKNYIPSYKWDEIQDAFRSLEDEIAKLKGTSLHNNEHVTIDNKDLIRQIIKPLGEKLHDSSLGYKSTYRKVYKAMNVGWKYRATKYQNQHLLKTVPKKIVLVQQDKTLLELFKITVGKMLKDN